VIVDGVPVLMPRDPDGGGSWISVNAAGHTLALLNRYEGSPHDEGGEYVSRGGLVSGMAGLVGGSEVAAEVERMELTWYRPFTLASVGRRQPPVLFEWNGRELVVVEVSNPGLVRSSSGSDQAESEVARSRVFRALGAGLSGADLLALHRTHLPQKGPLSICMHRSEAMTVSLSHITVDQSNLWIRYVGGSPCEASGMTELSL